MVGYWAGGLDLSWLSKSNIVACDDGQGLLAGGGVLQCIHVALEVVQEVELCMRSRTIVRIISLAAACRHPQLSPPISCLFDDAECCAHLVPEVVEQCLVIVVVGRYDGHADVGGLQAAEQKLRIVQAIDRGSEGFACSRGQASARLVQLQDGALDQDHMHQSKKTNTVPTST